MFTLYINTYKWKWSKHEVKKGGFNGCRNDIPAYGCGRERYSA